jgi:hypothetical protein
MYNKRNLLDSELWQTDNTSRSKERLVLHMTGFQANGQMETEREARRYAQNRREPGMEL